MPRVLLDDVTLTNRNKFVNGSLRIWQRWPVRYGETYGPPDRRATDSQKEFFADRWYTEQDITPCKPTIVSVTKSITPNVAMDALFPNSPVFEIANIEVWSDGTSASNYVHLIQAIEGVETLSGKNVTLSFGITSNINTTFHLTFDQYYGTYPLFPTQVTSPISIPIVIGTNRVEINADIPPLSAPSGGNRSQVTVDNCLRVRLTMLKGSDNSAYGGTNQFTYGQFYMTNFQLEAGGSSPMEYGDYASELKECQRYYENSASKTFTSTWQTFNGYYMERLFVHYSSTGGRVFGNLNYAEKRPCAGSGFAINTGCGLETGYPIVPHMVVASDTMGETVAAPLKFGYVSPLGTKSSPFFLGYSYEGSTWIQPAHWYLQIYDTIPINIASDWYVVYMPGGLEYVIWYNVNNSTQPVTSGYDGYYSIDLPANYQDYDHIPGWHASMVHRALSQIPSISTMRGHYYYGTEVNRLTVMAVNHHSSHTAPTGNFASTYGGDNPPSSYMAIIDRSTMVGYGPVAIQQNIVYQWEVDAELY